MNSRKLKRRPQLADPAQGWDRKFLFSQSPQARERRLKHLAPVVAGLLLGGVLVSPAADRALTKDYGCETTTVGRNQNMASAAISALEGEGRLLERDRKPALRAAVVYAAQIEQHTLSETGRVLHPGDQVRTCVSFNVSPRDLVAFNAGWHAGVKATSSTLRPAG
jgi:hypothetical protein